MATPSGLTATAINPAGLTPENLAKYEEALKASMDALQARYENPNWFNVAAGFLKPQLGGFAASLGSAGAAMGDWEEKRRANELPVAQMRAQLGLVGMQQQQLNAAEALFEANKGKMTPAIYAQIKKLNPGGPADVAAAGELQYAQSGIKVNAEARDSALKAVEYAKKNNIILDPSIYAAAGLPGPPVTQALPPVIPVTSSAAKAPTPVDAKARREETLASIAKMPPAAQAAAYMDFAKNPEQEFNLPGGPTSASKVSAENPTEQIQYIPRSYAVGPLGLNDVDRANIATTEAEHVKRFGVLGEAGSSEGYAKNARAVKDALKLLEDPRAEKVTGILQQYSGAWGSLLQAVQNGIGGSIGPFAGQLHADVAAIARARLPKDLKEYATALTTSLAQAGLAQQAASNINPSTVRTGELGTVIGATPNIDKPAATLRLDLRKTLADLDTAKAQYGLVESFVANKHPFLKQHPDVTASPRADIMNSDAFKKLASDNLLLREALTKDYLARLNKGNKP